MGIDVKIIDVWVLCEHCGEKHLLKRGLDAPIYWCSDELRKLVEGDEVEYDETNPLVLGGKG